jgi:hypothetical protein
MGSCNYIGWALLLHFLLVEFTLGIIGLLGSTAVYFFTQTLGVLFQALAVAIALLFWILLGCCKPGAWLRLCCFGGKLGKITEHMISKRILYAVASLLLHLITLIGWIIFASDSAASDDISPTENVGDYIARSNLHVLQTAVMIAMFGVFVYDMRRVEPSSNTTSPL